MLLKNRFLSMETSSSKSMMENWYVGDSFFLFSPSFFILCYIEEGKKGGRVEHMFFFPLLLTFRSSVKRWFSTSK